MIKRRKQRRIQRGGRLAAVDALGASRESPEEDPEVHVERNHILEPVSERRMGSC